MLPSEPPVLATEPQQKGMLHRAAARIAQHASHLVGQSSREDGRALRSSEVLLLELLQIARRRHWHGFAIQLLTERSRQHVQVLEKARTTAQQVAISAENDADAQFHGAPFADPDLTSMLSEAVQQQAEVTQLALGMQPVEGSVEVVLAHTKTLLSKFARTVAGLQDDDRERIDRSIEMRHRRLVVLGHAAPEGVGELEAQMKSMRDDASEPLHAHALAGLSLSGGGIRSASFAIGAMQALTRAAVLPAFDYISSVSGGGYAASWLAAWAYRHADGIHGVDRELFRSRDTDSGPLRWVRRHSSYLAPRPGLTSSDVWALFVAYVTNWLPILGLVSLAVMSLLLLPHALSAVAVALARSPLAGVPTFAAGTALLALVAYMGLVRRLTLFHRLPGKLTRLPVGLPPLVFWGALFVTLAISLTMPLMPALVRAHGWRAAGGWPFAPDLLLEPAATLFLFWLAASLLSWLIALALGTQWVQILADGFRTRVFRWKLNPSGRLCRNKTPAALLLLSMLVSSLLATLMAAPLFPMASASIDRPWLLIAFGPFTLMTVFAMAELSGLMLTLNYQRDVDRAWAARVGAWMLACVTAWTLLCIVSFGGSALQNEPALRGMGVPVAVSVALLATWRAAGQRGVLYLAVVVALLLPLMHLGLVRLTAPGANGGIDGPGVWKALAVACLLTVLLATLINVNRYSLHAIYKEGLVRTFLGASRLGPRNLDVRPHDGLAEHEASQFRARRPNPITNIDDEDNPALTWMKSRPGRELPILLLNAAVNGSSPTDLEGRVPRQWPFTFSQYYCGSPADGIGYAETANFFSHDDGDGMSLGTAMAVSGAAMSPTSGRTTHPIKAFILGVLNARLGIWIGNPRVPDAVRSPKPALAGFTVLREMLGRRAKFGAWIHLSDGGHFENLGVYELLRRGCRRIVVIDASCDPDRHFADLANAIRRARIDLGIRVSRLGGWEIFSPDGRTNGIYSSRAGHDTSDSGAAFGSSPPGESASAVNGPRKARAWTWFDINYGQYLPRGRLLYVKPSVYDDQVLPVEVRHYWRESPSFPHESTADQFFTERQLEAYRSLGESCVLDAMTVLDPIPASGATGSDDADPDLMRLVRRSLWKPRPTADDPV